MRLAYIRLLAGILNTLSICMLWIKDLWRWCLQSVYLMRHSWLWRGKQTHNQVLVEQLHAFLMKNKGWEVQKMWVVQSVQAPESLSQLKIWLQVEASCVWVFLWSSRGSKQSICQQKVQGSWFPLYCPQCWQGCLREERKQESKDMHAVNSSNLCVWQHLFILPWLSEEGGSRCSPQSTLQSCATLCHSSCV